MIDFSTLQGLTIPEGVVTQIADASGRVIWAMPSSDKVILQVEKKTSDTYAGETTYTAEEFILLDIYPKTNGTVSVTYGGLTKTITDTSGAEEPNAQQVFFGTFNGITDDIATPSSGELIIEGDYYAFATGVYSYGKITNALYDGIIAIMSFGYSSIIPDEAFGFLDIIYRGCEKLTRIDIPNTVSKIGNYAFTQCTGLESVKIPPSVKSMGKNPFRIASEYLTFTSTFGVDNIDLDGNEFYKKIGNCIIETDTKRIVCGTGDIVIPDDTKSIGAHAFWGRTDIPMNIVLPDGIVDIGETAFNDIPLESIVIPSSVTSIGDTALGIVENGHVIIQATTPPQIGNKIFPTGTDENPHTITITVPKGCGATYKTAEGWSTYADYIVEES